MTRIALPLLCTAITLSGQTLAPPLGGMVVDGRGRLQSVRGVMGNLMPGDAVALPGELNTEAVISAAFSGSRGAVKTADRLLITNSAGEVLSRQSAPAGPALFSFAPDGSLAWVCYPESARMESMNAGASWDTSGWGDSVIALGGAGSALPVLVRTGSQLWVETIDTGSGAVRNQTPIAGSAPGVWFQSGWLVQAKGGLLWFAPGRAGEGQAIPVPDAVTSLQTAGPNTVAVNAKWLLNARFQLLEIPVRPRWRSSAPRGTPR